LSFFLYGNPFDFYFSHIIITMTQGSVAFCIATAFAVFAAYAKKTKADADKAKTDADKAKADADKAKADADKAKADADKAKSDADKAKADADKAKADADKAKADADKAKADADKAKDDKIAELNTEIDFLQSSKKIILDKYVNKISEFNQRTTNIFNNHTVEIDRLLTIINNLRCQTSR
jgi:uncharacterized protein (DUF3084 family)